MNVVADALQVERFSTLIASHLGLRFENTKASWLADVLQRRMASCGLLVEPYIAQLEAKSQSAEWRALARELTIGETYFFRNIEQFHALREVALPERLQARATRRCLRILSAGCASGEEAYSIAMTLNDMLLDPSWEFSIRAVDLNVAMIEKARLARYTPWALRETPRAMLERWFRPEGREFILDGAICSAVAFEERNLNVDDMDLWYPGAYDVIFCRNVLMYFTPESAQIVVGRIARALAPGGFLFLGHAENLRGLSQSFDLRNTHGTFYYRLNGDVASPSAALPMAHLAPLDTLPALAAIVEGTDSWVDTISKAAERIRALTLEPKCQPEALSTAPVNGGIAHVLELFQLERFAEALCLVQELPGASAGDPDVLLLHAVLLVHSGQLPLAEGVCRRLLEVDAPNAGAHYVLALCREGAGDSSGATAWDQSAIQLDPTFAMPRLHLGLLARRAGDHDMMRRELGQALLLLQREDASRLLLFGGGFKRETLLTLCRAELQADRESA